MLPSATFLANLLTFRTLSQTFLYFDIYWINSHSIFGVVFGALFLSLKIIWFMNIYKWNFISYNSTPLLLVLFICQRGRVFNFRMGALAFQQLFFVPHCLLWKNCTDLSDLPYSKQPSKPSLTFRAQFIHRQRKIFEKKLNSKGIPVFSKRLLDTF